jgi:hypothetical protein
MPDDGGTLHDPSKAFRGWKRTEYVHPVHAQPGSHEQIGGIGIAMLQHLRGLQRMCHPRDQRPRMSVVRVVGTQSIGEIFRAPVVDPAEAPAHTQFINEGIPAICIPLHGA